MDSLGWDLTVYMSNMFPDHADAAGHSEDRFHNQYSHKWRVSCSYFSLQSGETIADSEILNTVHLMK